MDTPVVVAPPARPAVAPVAIERVPLAPIASTPELSRGASLSLIALDGISTVNTVENEAF